MITSKYALLIILNLPFIVYGYIKAVVYFKEALYNKSQLAVRLIFWTAALAIVVFAEPIYNFLIGNDLTTSTPLSLADVLLATLGSLTLTLVIRLYARTEKAERKISELIEAIALKEIEEP